MIHGSNNSLTMPSSKNRTSCKDDWLTGTEWLIWPKFRTPYREFPCIRWSTNLSIGSREIFRENSVTGAITLETKFPQLWSTQTRRCLKWKQIAKPFSPLGLRAWLWIRTSFSKWASLMSTPINSLKWFLVRWLRVTRGAQDLLAPRVAKAPCFNRLVKMFYRARCKDNRIYTVNPSKTWALIKWRIRSK